LAQQYSAETTLCDFGFLSVGREHGFRWGAVVQNLGSGLKYKQAREPLPLTYRFGGAWQGPVPSILAQPLTISAEGIVDRENKKGAAAGLEYWGRHYAGCRAGYQWSQNQQARWTAGLGIRLPGPLAGGVLIDYAFQMIGELGSMQRLSLSYEFGPG